MSIIKLNIISVIFFILVNNQAIAVEKDHAETEALLQEKIKTQNDNPALHFQLARVLAWQKKYNKALSEYDWLLKKFPSNSDYLLGKAQTLYWSGQSEAALKILELTRKASPDYIDVWRLQISILQKSNSKSDQTKSTTLLAEAKKRFPGSQWQGIESINNTPGDKSYTEIELGLTFDKLDNNYDNWSSTYLMAEHQYKNSNKLYASATQTERFKLDDNEVMLGYFMPINTDWNVVVEASKSPTSRVRAKWSAFVQIQRGFGDGWNGYLGLRKTSYNETTTQALSFIVERYWQNFRFSYTGYVTEVSGTAISTETLNAHTLATDYYYNDINRYGLAVTTGKELEYDGSSNPPISSITTIIFKGRHWFTPKWAINYDFTFHEQGNFYSRYGYRLGLRYRY